MGPPMLPSPMNATLGCEGVWLLVLLKDVPSESTAMVQLPSGMVKLAPSLVPEGQRVLTVLVLE
ncbi:hypothetical protein GCM10009650_06310 [Nesterenkonia jeotgali]